MPEIYYFASFALDVSERTLSRGRRAIPLPPKTLDLLIALLRRAGQLVTKRELLETVWPGVFVDAGILTVHVATARKALGPRERTRYIETVIGSGYRFVAPVTTLARGGPRQRPRSREAEDSVARGRTLLLSGASVSLPEAKAAFANAIALDDAYAAAHAGLALAHCAEATLYVSPHASAFAAAKTSALRALARDDQDVDALTALGVVLLSSEWDWSAAERSLRRGLTLQPSHVEAQLYLGALLDRRGELVDGLQLMHRALACQPDSPLILVHIAMSHWHRREIHDAINWATRAIAREPRQLLASEFLAIVYWSIGDIRSLASERLRRAQALGLADEVVARMNERGEALCRVAEREGVSGVNRWLLEHFTTGDDSRASVQRAALLAAEGSPTEAFAHLDRALAARAPAMVDLAVSPLWDRLRGDPRFATRLHGVGIGGTTTRDSD